MDKPAGNRFQTYTHWGAYEIEVADEPELVELLAGQAFWVEPGVRVRYSNPYEQESEYFAVCMPAFQPDAANREG